MNIGPLILRGLALLATLPAARADTCVIDAGENHQTIDGFGFAAVWAPVLTPAQAASFFGTGDGQLGFSLLRVYISETGDFATDAANAAIAHAWGVRVLGSAWTPPPAMKSNNSAVGGSLNPDQYGAYAAYLATAAATIGLDYVSPQNEPDIGVTYQSCFWTPAQLATWCRDFAPAVGRPIVMPESYRFDDAYADPTLNDPVAASHVAIVGGHIYGSGNTVHADGPAHGKHVWMTEHFNNDQTLAAALVDAREVSDCLSHEMNAYIWWRAFHTSLATDDLIDGATPQKNGYAIGQFSRFLRPGMVRCGATYSPNPGVYVTAYRGNGLVVVAVNTGATSVNQAFVLRNAPPVSALELTRTSATEDMAPLASAAVVIANNTWTAALPAQSVTTFRQARTPPAVATLAGAPGSSGAADGTGAAARFDHPADLAVDRAGNLVVADAVNDTIRRVTPAGAVTTLAGAPHAAGATDSPPRFNQPAGVAVDASGNVFVADTDNHTIRRIAPDGTATTLAGQPGVSGSADGAGPAARFNGPSGIAVDAAGVVYVADTLNHTIRRIDAAGNVTTLAGSAGVSGDANAAGAAARFFGPQGLALGHSGDLYVADTNNHTIRRIDLASRSVTIAAGLTGAAGSGDGIAADARFNAPSGIAVDGVGNVFIADLDNSAIRELTPGGVVTTVAGRAGSAGSADGPADAARFNHPTGIAVDAAGTVYVADTDNSTIRSFVVRTGPIITSQPQSQTVAAGAGVQFSVTATGVPAVAYQWSFNGSAIAGATGATFSLASAQAANAGNYQVTVTNTAGSVASDAAALTVNVPPAPPSGGGGGGGGGGVPSAPFLVALALLAAARAWRRSL